MSVKTKTKERVDSGRFTLLKNQEAWPEERKALYGTLNRSTRVLVVALPNAAWKEISSIDTYNPTSSSFEEYRMVVYKTDMEGRAVLDENGNPIPLREKIAFGKQTGEEEYDKEFKIVFGESKTMVVELPKQQLIVEQLLMHPANRDRILETGEPYRGSEDDIKTRSANAVTPPMFYLVFQDAQDLQRAQSHKEQTDTLTLVSSWQYPNEKTGGFQYSPELLGACLALQGEEDLVGNSKDAYGSLNEQLLLSNLTAYILKSPENRRKFINLYIDNIQVSKLLRFRFALFSGIIRYNSEDGYYFQKGNNPPALLGNYEDAAIDAFESGTDNMKYPLKDNLLALSQVSGFTKWKEAFDNRKEGKPLYKAALLPDTKDKMLDSMTEELAKQTTEIKQRDAAIEALRLKLVNSGITLEEVNRLVDIAYGLKKD